MPTLEGRRVPILLLVMLAALSALAGLWARSVAPLRTVWLEPSGPRRGPASRIDPAPALVRSPRRPSPRSPGVEPPRPRRRTPRRHPPLARRALAGPASQRAGGSSKARRRRGIGSRISGAYRLAASDPEAGVRQALSRLQRYPALEPLEAEELIRLVHRRPDARVRSALWRLTRAAHPRVRGAALEALAAVDPEAAMAQVVRWAWSEPDEGLRRRAVRLLGRYEAWQAHSTLRLMHHAETDEHLRDLIGRVLGTRRARGRR